MTYDVVIVGGSIAGCTAAILYGRAGLRVALLEKNSDIATFKVLCGHYVLSGTQDMLRRTGLWDAMVAAGAYVGNAAAWSRDGWTVAPDDLPLSICLRRERLDPLLRHLAADTPGVDLILGHQAVGLLTQGLRYVGVRTRDRAGAEHQFRGRLVVGADGHLSTVAALAEVTEYRAVNNRFGMWAYYGGVVSPAPGDGGAVWQLDPDLAFLLPEDDSLTTLAVFPTKARLPEFREHGIAALEQLFRELPDGPDLSEAHRVSNLIEMIDYPFIARDPTPAPGLMLVGDAAITGDPATAVGCGWAFRSAEWLANSTAPALHGMRTMRSARARYCRHLSFIMKHDTISRREALALPMNAMQRATQRAATVNDEINRRVYRFTMRVDPVSKLFNPVTTARTLLAARRFKPPVVATPTET